MLEDALILARAAHLLMISDDAEARRELSTLSCIDPYRSRR
jgi:hypothetical protein